MINPNMLQFIPDEHLKQSLQGGAGVVPPYLATAELNRRNKLRAGNMAKPPQSSVSQDVTRSLQSNGFTPSGPAGQGIVSGHYGDGGSAEDKSNLMGGIVPSFQNPSAAPVQYNPSFAPTDLSLDQAQKSIAPLYGKGPDYQSTQQSFKQNQADNGRHGYGIGEYLMDLVGNTAGGKFDNPVKNFGAALVSANTKQHDLQQTNFSNQNSTNMGILDTQKAQAARESAIANSTREWTQNQQTIADAQARAKAANDAGNRDAALSITKEINSNLERKAQLEMNAYQLAGNPVTAQIMAKDAAANGNTDRANFFNSAYQTGVNNEQRKTSMATAAEVARQNNESKNKMAQISAQSNKEIEVEKMKTAYTLLASSWTPDEIYSATGIRVNPHPSDSSSGATAAPGAAAPPAPPPQSAKIIDPEGYQAASNLDTMSILAKPDANGPGIPVDGMQAARTNDALDLIRTGQMANTRSTGDKGAYMNAVRRRAAEIMQKLQIDPSSDLPGIRATYKSLNSALQKNTGMSLQLEDSENKLNTQLEAFSAMAQRLNKAGYDMHGWFNNIERFKGTPEYTMLKDYAVTIPDEFAKVMSGARAGEADRGKYAKLIGDFQSGANAAQTTRAMKNEMAAAHEGVLDTNNNIRYQMRMDNLIKVAKGKGNPPIDPLVAERASLPSSADPQYSGAMLPSQEDVQKYLIAAAHKLGKSVVDKNDPEIRKEARSMMAMKGFGGAQ